MDVTRKIELSLYEHIISIVPSMVLVVPSFGDEEIVLPSVAIDVPRFYAKPLELGNQEGLRQQLVTIDVYANSKQQRDDLGDLLYASFAGTILVYDFELGPAPPLPPTLGYLRVLNRTSEPIIVFRDLVEKFYWRRKITLNMEYQEI